MPDSPSEPPVPGSASPTGLAVDPEDRASVGPRERPAAIGFILITLLLDILGIGLIIPIMPNLVKQLTGQEGNESVYGLLMGSYALMQFLCAPIIGALSDRFGRRPILLISIFTLGVDFVLTGLVPSLSWLFVIRMVSGATAANITAANAYIADVSTAETRVRNFGLAGAMFGIGFIFGPVIGGLLGHYWLRLPFFVAAGLSLANFIYGYFVLPESLPVSQRRSTPLYRLNPFYSLASLRAFPGVLPIAAVFLCNNLAEHSMRSTWVLFTTKRFGWDEADNGLALGTVGIMFAVIQGGLVRPIAKALGNYRTLCLGLICSATAYFIYAGVNAGWMMYCVMLIGAFGGVAWPAAQSLVGEQVPSSQQGAVQGALTSMASLAAVIAPPVATLAFQRFSAPTAPVYLPGIAFLGAATLQLVALSLVVLYVGRNAGRSTSATHADADAEPATASTDEPAPAFH